MRNEKLLKFVEKKLPRNLNTVKTVLEQFEQAEKEAQLDDYLVFLKQEYGEDLVKSKFK
jgi:hypothetical protein